MWELERVRARGWRILLCVMLVVASVSVVPPPVTVAAPAWYTQLISVSMTGGVSSGDHNPWDVDPRGPDISGDGRYVVWTSSAADLVPGGSTAYDKYDVFWRDRVAGITKRVSDSEAGANGNDSSWGGVVSGDGRYVAFLSEATNLVPDDTNGVQDAFVRDMVTDAVVRVSVTDYEAQSTGPSWGPLAMTDDGYEVLFASASSSFGYSMQQVYLRNWQTGTTVCVSLDAASEPGVDSSLPSDITPDGRFVAFTSNASNITGEAGYQHIVVRDRNTGNVWVVNFTAAQERMEAYHASLSDDGRYCAFHGARRGDSTYYRVWVRDVQESTTELISKSSGGTEADDTSWHPEISGDGRYVVFESHASNLVSGDTNDAPDIFRHDRQTGATERMSLTTAGQQAPATSAYARVSRDGQAVAFAGQGLVPEDNTGGQIYVRAYGEPPAPPPTNTAPVALGDVYSTPYGTMLSIAAPGVLANDTDANGDALTAIKVSNPGHGTVSLLANGSFTYTPQAGYSGTDTFTYKANDGTADSNTATVTITVGAAPPPPGPEGVTRLADRTRFSTAIAIAKDGFPGWAGVKHVIIASGDDRAAADPLAASGLCWAYDAPMLLVSAASTPYEVKAAIKQIVVANGPITLHVVGGPVSVPDARLAELVTAGGGPGKVVLDRILRTGGRFDLAAAIALRIKSVALVNPAKTMPKVVLFANGADTTKFFDALALSPISSGTGAPVLLVTETSVPAATATAVKALAPTTKIVGGGPKTVSEAVRAQLGATRWSGATRYDTAIAIANGAVSKGWFTRTYVGLAAKLPDALTGGSLVGWRKGVLVLTDGANLTPVTKTWLAAHRKEITTAYLFGGPLSISDGVKTQVANALK